MPPSPPPNDALAELAAVLGRDNVRTLVQTFLREFPVSFGQLSGGERHNRHRIAHSMKSNSRIIGAFALSKRMAEIEARLSEDNGRDITPDDLPKSRLTSKPSPDRFGNLRAIETKNSAE